MNNEGSSQSSSSWLRSFIGRLWNAISVPLAAVFLALLIGGIILWISGAPPVKAYVALFQGAFGSPEAIQRGRRIFCKYLNGNYFLIKKIVPRLRI